MKGKRDIQGFGSVSRELSESTTLKMDSAGDQLFFRMSMHTFPLSEIFMWYILDIKLLSEKVTSERISEPCLKQNFRCGKSVTNSLKTSPSAQSGKRYTRIIMAEHDLDVEHPTFINAALWPGNACPPKKGIVIDGSDRNVAQVLFLEVGDFTLDAL